MAEKKQRPPGRNWDTPAAVTPPREKSWSEKIMGTVKDAVKNGLLKGDEKVAGTDETRRKFKFN